MIPALHRRPIFAFMARYRGAFVLAVVVAVVSSGTAAAVSSLVLSTTNTAAKTTTLKSGVNGAVLQVTNKNTTGGTNARGLGISVPAGRAPITVNASAGKATNLNADKLDGLDQSAFARVAHGTNVTILANRLVLGNGDTNVVLLTLPGLGVLIGTCDAGFSGTEMYWSNTTSANIDVWTNTGVDGRLHGAIAGPGGLGPIAAWNAGSQKGDTLLLGQGNDPGARRTATVTLGAYRSAAGQPCGLQATATLWSTP